MKHVSTYELNISQIFDIRIYVLNRCKGVEKLSTIILQAVVLVSEVSI